MLWHTAGIQQLKHCCLACLQIRAERDAVAAKHAAALYDLQRLPALLRLLGLHVLQVSGHREGCQNLCRLQQSAWQQHHAFVCHYIGSILTAEALLLVVLVVGTPAE